MERSAFNIERTANFTSMELHYFERCKEERLSKDRSGDAFVQLVTKTTPLDLELLSNRTFFIGFLSYIIAIQLRQVISI